MLLCLLVLLCHRYFVVVGVERCVVVLMCCVVSVLWLEEIGRGMGVAV